LLDEGVAILLEKETLDEKEIGALCEKHGLMAHSPSRQVKPQAIPQLNPQGDLARLANFASISAD
jgi:hypothetical protein